MHTYLKQGDNFQVGFYFPYCAYTLGGTDISYKWRSLDSFDKEADARQLVNYLNGGNCHTNNL